MQEYKNKNLTFQIHFIVSKDFSDEYNLNSSYYFLNKYKVSLQGNLSDEIKEETTNLLFIASNEHNDKYISYLGINKKKLGFNEIKKINKNLELESVDLESNFLSKRLNMIFKAEKLKTFGIIATNPRMTDFKELFKEAKTILKKSDKRHYTFIMNKVNETKLRNFPDIQAFVMISCPFSSFLECAEFKLPIFSVMELQLFEDLCKIDKVNIIDYKIKNKPKEISKEKEEEEQKEKLKNEMDNMQIDIPKLRVPMLNEDWVDLTKLDQEQKMQLYKQDSELVLTSFYKHYEYFRDKNWKGLDTDIDVPVQKAVKGEVGIPLSYNKIKD
jgi:diphthamide biosynthesis protein 2